MQTQAEEARPFAHPDSHSISNLTLFAMTLFSILYMISEPNLDGFNLEEALEYVSNATLDSIAIHVAGFATSFVSNMPLLATIIFCWMNEARHEEDHDHDHDHDHSHVEHQHSITEEVIELVTIGTPFGLMGCAAFLNTLNYIYKINDNDVTAEVFGYIGAGIAGTITGFGAYKLHGFHAHAAMDEHGGGITGFFKALYVTFLKNVWAAHERQQNIPKKIMAIFNEFWKKYGIVAAHGFLGLFAAETFLEQTGLANQNPTFDLVLKIFLPVAVMVFEGNTEARSLDSYRQIEEQPISYSLSSKLIVNFSAVFHTIPPVTALAKLMGSTKEGPLDGSLYNAFIYLAAASILAYPNINGFSATTIAGYDKAAKELKKKIKSCVGLTSREDYDPLDEEHTRRPCCAVYLVKFGFTARSRKLDLLKSEYIGLDDSAGYGKL